MTQSKTDWERVLAHKEGDAIPYEPEDGPYDPNDVKATQAFFAQADLVRHGKAARPAKGADEEAGLAAIVP